MKVGDLVKEKNGPGIAIIVAVIAAESIGTQDPYLELVYLDGEPFRHSSRAYEVINASR